MGVIDSFSKFIEEQKSIERYLSDQQIQKWSFDRRKWDYWRVALTVDEAIKACSSLRVETPLAPKQLMSPSYDQKTYISLSFVLKRNPDNTPCSNNPTLPHEVETTLTDYLTICGYSGFGIECTEDTYKYYVTVHKSERFCLGAVLNPRVGEIRYDWRFYVALYQGGFPLILPTTTLHVYRFGVWHKSGIRLVNNCPYLDYCEEPLESFRGYIARI